MVTLPHEYGIALDGLPSYLDITRLAIVSQVAAVEQELAQRLTRSLPNASDMLWFEPQNNEALPDLCLLYTSPSPRD